MLLITRRTAALALCLAANLCLAQAVVPPASSVRLRGTVQSVAPGLLTVKERGGEVIELVMPDKLAVSEVYPIALSDIKPGSFIGTAAMPQADGTERAIAVTVFPESARGAGEGHRPFDLVPQSTMTNATVADVVAAPTGTANTSVSWRRQREHASSLLIPCCRRCKPSTASAIATSAGLSAAMSASRQAWSHPGATASRNRPPPISNASATSGRCSRSRI